MRDEHSRRIDDAIANLRVLYTLRDFHRYPLRCKLYSQDLRNEPNIFYVAIFTGIMERLLSTPISLNFDYDFSVYEAEY